MKILLKAHISGYTKTNGTYVMPHEDKRQKLLTRNQYANKTVDDYATALYTNNPGGQWLKNKITEAEKAGRNEFGAPHMGTATATFNQPILIHIDTLQNLKGIKGEDTSKRVDELSSTKKTMRESGKFPLNGNMLEELPYIQVGFDGKPWVRDGINQIFAAKELNWKHIPVTVKYFNGGENTAVPNWKPQELFDAQNEMLNQVLPKEQKILLSRDFVQEEQKKYKLMTEKEQQAHWDKQPQHKMSHHRHL